MPGLTTWTRRIDFLGRSIPVPLGIGPAEAWHIYLTTKRTGTVVALRKKPVVLLELSAQLGMVVWMPDKSRIIAAPR